MTNDYIICYGELYHWGIKGQKWGVRRYQNKDGTLTPAGKKRYNDTPDTAKQKTTHRERLEAKYRQNGMSEKQAEIAASRRIKIEKAIGITAGMTLAAVTAYAANKYIKEHTDKVIKSGMTMQRVTGTPDESLDRAFYAAFKKSDTAKYKGLYGEQIGAGKAHKILMKVNSDVKIASRDKAAKAFVDLYKNDPEFKKQFLKSNVDMHRAHVLGGMPAELFKQAGREGLTDRQLKKIGYEAFNVGLVNHTPDANSIAKKFYDKLKQQGYDAIMDINDQKHSGYDAKAPVIVFNNAGKISISEVKKMTESQIASNVKEVRKRLVTGALAKEGAKVAGVVIAGTYAGKTMNAIAIDNYKIEHPNTKLTDKQILDALGRQ